MASWTDFSTVMPAINVSRHAVMSGVWLLKSEGLKSDIILPGGVCLRGVTIRRHTADSVCFVTNELLNYLQVHSAQEYPNILFIVISP
jgi:hypothetical protein